MCLCPELQSDGQKNHIPFLFPKKFSMTSMEKDVMRVQKDADVQKNKQIFIRLPGVAYDVGLFCCYTDGEQEVINDKCDT